MSSLLQISGHLLHVFQQNAATFYRNLIKTAAVTAHSREPHLCHLCEHTSTIFPCQPYSYTNWYRYLTSLSLCVSTEYSNLLYEPTANKDCSCAQYFFASLTLYKLLQISGLTFLLYFYLNLINKDHSCHHPALTSTRLPRLVPRRCTPRPAPASGQH